MERRFLCRGGRLRLRIRTLQSVACSKMDAPSCAIQEFPDVLTPAECYSSPVSKPSSQELLKPDGLGLWGRDPHPAFILSENLQSAAACFRNFASRCSFSFKRRLISFTSSSSFSESCSSAAGMHSSCQRSRVRPCIMVCSLI